MGNCMSSKGTDQVVSCRLAEDCPPLIDIPGVNIDNPYNQSSKSPSRSGHSEDQTSEENRAASSSTDNPEWFHECIKLLNDIKATNDIDVLIPLIKKTLQKKKAMQQNNPVNDSTGSQEPQQMEEEESLWTSLTNKGSKFLNHIKDSVKKNWHEGIKTTAEILENVSKVNSVVGWLSIISYLLFTIGKGTDNQTECLNLLEDMINLAEEVKSLENTIEEEKFKKAIKLIAEGSITCYSQLESQIFSRTINATVNSETLSSISSKINQLILDLTWTVVTNIDARIPGYVPPKPPLYPHWAVAIEKQVNDIVNLLSSKDEPSLAVVIHGLDGIGKTTIAEAVLAEIDLNRYNYTKVAIYQEQENNDFKSLQQQILRDCFPTYNNGKPVVLRDCKDGRDAMVKASIHEEGKPIFLFIDNASRSLDLKELLPTYTVQFPRGSRILLTTRRSAATDIFKKLPNVERILYPLKPLAKDDDALKILFTDPTKRGNIENDCLERILKICSGVPLALKIVSAHLQKQRRLLDALEGKDEIEEEKLEKEKDEKLEKEKDEKLKKEIKDEKPKKEIKEEKKKEIKEEKPKKEIKDEKLKKEIKEEKLEKEKDEKLKKEIKDEKLEEEINEEKLKDLSDRLVDFVYNELDKSTQEAFLDICCFFSNWKRQDVEYIVGASEVANLMEVGLIASIAIPEISYFQEADEVLIVHDIVIAKGRSLGKDNRFMDLKSLCEAADEERLDQIKGIWLVKEKSHYVLQERHLNSMEKSLRVLALGDRMRFSKAKEMKFEELRFLRIGGSIPQLPVKLEVLNNLKVFHGPFSISGEVIMCKLPKSLLAMKIIDNKSKNPEVEQFVDNKSKNSEVEEVLQYQKLEKLHFTGLKELGKLLEGSIKLDALKTFILEDFSIMEELPKQICSLPSLSELSITKSGSLKCLPESFGQLTTLKQLQLSDLLGLKRLPSTFSEFRALTHLNLEGCRTLETFPSNLKKLTALTHLSLSGCESLKDLPSDFGYLTALKYLNLGFCEKLQILPSTFGNLTALKHLCLKQCTMLQSLPSNFRDLTALQYLNLYNCEKLEVLPSLFRELGALKCLECSFELEGKVKSQINKQVLIVAY